MISILGGTGTLGKGLALRLALAGYDVVVGSRSEEKAILKAEEYSEICGIKIRGMSNDKAIEVCDLAILAIPWEDALKFVEEYRDELSRKIVVSPIVPMRKEGDKFVYAFEKGSMAERISKILGKNVVSAFQNVPARRFSDLNEKPRFDVVVCSDDEDYKKTVMEIVRSIEDLRALDGGPLSNSRFVETLTPFMINVATLNGLRELSVLFV